MHLEIVDTRTLTDAEPKTYSLEFHNTPISIGSASANTIQLPETNIPAYHAMILPQSDEEDDWLLQPAVLDVEILVNDVPVTIPVHLEDGDVIAISHFQLKFSLDLPPELALPEPGDLDELAKIKQYPLPSRADVRKGDDDITLSHARQLAIASFGLKLRTCNDFAQLLEVTCEMLLAELGARTAWMGARRSGMGPLESVLGKASQGEYNGEPWMLEGLIYRCMNRGQHIRLPKTGQPDTQSLLAVPIVGKRGALGLLMADTRRRTKVFDESDLAFITLAAHLVASQLEAIVRNVNTQREAITASEVSFLREVQAQLDPKNVPQWPGVQISAYSKPGVKTAGDVYDISRLPNGLAAILVGNVSSPSPLRTAQALSAVRTAFRTGTLHAEPPHVMLKVFNWLLFDEQEPCTLTAAVLIMNPKTGAAEYATAGDIGALIISQKGEPRQLTEVDLPPVGSAKVIEFGAKKARISGGETLAFFTWGCATAEDKSGNPVGKSRFVEVLCDGFGQVASATMEDLLADLGPHLKDGTPPDDITVLLLHRDSV